MPVLEVASTPEIARRLRAIEIAEQIDNQALCNWYAHDVTDLLREVLQLRKERQHALEQLGVLPIEPSDDLLVLVRGVQSLWEHKLSQWQRQKMAELKTRTEAAELAATEAEARAAEADQRAEQTQREARAAIETTHQEARQRILDALHAQHQAEQERDQAHAAAALQKLLVGAVLQTLRSALDQAQEESEHAGANAGRE